MPHDKKDYKIIKDDFLDLVKIVDKLWRHPRDLDFQDQFILNDILTRRGGK